MVERFSQFYSQVKQQLDITTEKQRSRDMRWLTFGLYQYQEIILSDTIIVRIGRWISVPWPFCVVVKNGEVTEGVHTKQQVLDYLFNI